METNNGKHTYFADAVGQPLSKPHIASQVASPINLLNPDRYEFYTFNDDGELVKRLMTLKEIQGIIAGGDSESAGYNSPYHSQLTNPENDVSNVVENVQNVLKEEIEAHKGPLEGKPILDTPDVSANWNLILPAIFGDTMMNDAITLDEIYQLPNNGPNNDDSSTEYMKLSSRTPDGGEDNDFEQNLLSQSSTQTDTTTDHLLAETTQTFATDPKMEEDQMNLPSSPSLFSIWFDSTSTKSVPTEEIKPVLTSTESIMEPVTEPTIRFTSIQNVEHKVTNEPIQVTEKVSESNPTFDENKSTPQQYESTSPFIESTKTSTGTSSTNKTPQIEDKIIAMALTSEKTNTPAPVTETITNKTPSSFVHTTSGTNEFPKITELVSIITRPTTKEAEKTTSTTTVRTSSVTFPHSSQFAHSTELVSSSTVKPLTSDAGKIDTPSLTITETTSNDDHQDLMNNLNTNTEIPTENVDILSSAVTETAAILNTNKNENVDFGQDAGYQPTETNMDSSVSTSTEYGIVADIDRLIANISEEIITKNENIPIENYNVSEIIQQILNYPTNASEIINQTITLASLIVDSNRESATTENTVKENTASLLQTGSTNNNEATIESTVTPVLLSTSIIPTTVITTESTLVQADQTISTTEKIRTTLDNMKLTTENYANMDDSKLTTENLQLSTDLLKTTPEMSSSSITASTPASTVTTTKLTTPIIPKTPSTINVPTVQPTTTTVKITTEKVTTPFSTTLESTESSTKLDVTEEQIVTNKISELLNTPVVLNDENIISVAQMLTSVPSNNSTKSYITQTTEEVTQTSTSESTTVKSSTAALESTILTNSDITAENLVTKEDKTTEQPKISSTTITKFTETNKITTTEKPIETVSSTVSATSISETRKPVPEITTTLPSATKAVSLSASSTTRRKTIPPTITTTSAKPVTTTSKPITTSSKPVTTPSMHSSTSSKSIATSSKPISTSVKPVTTSIQPIVTSGKVTTINDNPKTTTGKTVTPTRVVTNKTTNGILNISEPYRRTEDLLHGTNPSDTWKLVQTVQAPHSSSNKKHPTTALSGNRYSTEKPNIEPYQPTVTIDMSTQGTFGMPVLSEDMNMFSKMYNELALKFWNALSVKDISSDRSATVSPFGAISMLAMVFLGARGGTSGEMNDVLKLDDIVTFNPHLVFKEVTESLIGRKPLSAIIRELYTDGGKGKVLDFYKESVRQFYDGHVEEVDFKRINNVIRRRTNALINKQTRGQLSQYLEETTLSLKAPLSALSTNIFQADCSKASTEGRDGELYFIVLPTMRQRRLVPIPAAVWRSGFIAGYDPELDATAVSLGTMNQDIGTVFVIPGQQGHSAPGDVLLRLEARLLNTTYIAETWTQLLKSMMPRPGLEIQIPRFLHKSVINTNDALKRMGLDEMYHAGKANLQGINGIAHALYFSDMVQINEFWICGDGPQVHAEIYPSTTGHLENPNEQMRNFKYVDYTVDTADYDGASLPLPLRPRQARLPDVPRLRFDRPFLYFVRHNPTGLILHMGRFNPKLVT